MKMQLKMLRGDSESPFTKVETLALEEKWHVTFGTSAAPSCFLYMDAVVACSNA